jgi:segregation and condensation protein B
MEDLETPPAHSTPEQPAVENETPEDGVPPEIAEAEEIAAAAADPQMVEEGIDVPPPEEIDPELDAVEAAVVIEDDSIDMDALLAGTEPEPAPLADSQLRAVIEAIVYVADEPLTLAQLAGALSEPPERVLAILDQVIAEFEKPEHGLTVREVAGGYKMATKAEHHDAVRTFVKSLKPPLKLSLPALETLAVIAYKQPVTAPEIMEIRGVQGAGVLKTLLDRKLIAGAGRKNVIGKPILYKTTKEFLIQFGLKDLSELPSLKEFEEIRRMAFSDDLAAADAPPEGAPEAAAPVEAPVEAPVAEAPAAEAPAEVVSEEPVESAE